VFSFCLSFFVVIFVSLLHVVVVSTYSRTRNYFIIDIST